MRKWEKEFEVSNVQQKQDKHIANITTFIADV